MLRKIEVIALFVLVLCLSAFAAQKQELKIVPDPNAAGVRSASDTIVVEWVQLTYAGSQDLTAAHQGEIYYARTPAAGDLSKYVRVGVLESSNQPGRIVGAERARRSSFVPSRQSGMGPGLYYCVVASVVGGDTLYSDYFTLMVESAAAPTIISPKADMSKGELVAKVGSHTPHFSWRPVTGVPYYHVILSDEPLIHTVDGSPEMNPNISVIWQVITPATGIAYGAPDPSGTITAVPPPLTPGKTYSWLVLNNYGNHMAFSSNVLNYADALFGRFEITGTAIDAPRVVSPADVTFNNDRTIEFKWTNLDTRAMNYRVDLFTTTATDQLAAGGISDDMSASLLAWTTTVSRGGRGKDETLSVNLDAAGTLTGGKYSWRVYALDSRGAGSTDSTSTAAFTYNADMGTVSIKTLEMIGGAGGFQSPVGLVELRTEVLQGPTQAPLAFFTDTDGNASGRSFPRGRYRITAVKEGYNSQSVTVNVGNDDVVTQIFMTRPEAILYGHVQTSDGSSVNMAKVTAVSEWGDTLTAFTGGGGNFTIGCGAASWTVTVERAGYRASIPRRVNLRLGDNRNFGTVVLERNPNPLTGVVRNASAEPLTGVRVRVFTAEGVLVDELASTPQNGLYAFYLNAGRYILTAEKPGFVMFSREITVTSSSVIDIAMPQGAALVNGVIMGKSWVAERDDFVSAPVTSAIVRFWEDGAVDTFVVTSDATFGRFSVSLPIDRTYNVRPTAVGFAPAPAGTFETSAAAIADQGGTLAFADTLTAFMMIKGAVMHGGSPLGGVDVIVYSGAEAVASARTSVNGSYELRNIPDGQYTVRAGRSGYYMVSSEFELNVENGRPEVNIADYNFEMGVGDKSIVWDVVRSGGADSGAVKVVLPFNRVVRFDYTDPNPNNHRIAGVSDVGPGDYVIEAVAESNPSLLELSYSRFNVAADASEAVVKTVRFPIRHIGEDTLKIGSEGMYRLSIDGAYSLSGVNIREVELFYRSEGRTQFASTTTGAISTSIEAVNTVNVDFSPAQVRDGVNLFYYFRVHLSDGTVYGSSKQLWNTFVRPEPTIVSRIAVNPGVTGRDTLVLPSSYAAEFKFSAFYSDRFLPINIGDADTVKWFVGGSESSSRGVNFTYSTPSGKQDQELRAVFRSLRYSMKAGVSDTVKIPLRITGQSLESVTVMRRGAAGPISSAEPVGFRAQALDKEGNLVTVVPQWSVSPASAGKMSEDGTFTPALNFFGVVRITATAGDAGKGGVSCEYTEEGGEFPGQSVYYMFRHRESGSSAPAELNTGRGFSLNLKDATVPAGSEVKFSMSTPELKNYVQRGSDDYRMADTLAFDLECDGVDSLGGVVAITIAIPERLREAARKNSQEIKIAKWFPDSLKWIPVANSDFADNYTVAVARVTADAGAVDGLVFAKSPAVTAKRAAAASAQALNKRTVQLGREERYALVTKTRKLTASMSISPHPFSPYIRPVKEYGPDAPAGTCIKVNVEAPEGSVKSIKVHIFNPTGTRVWAVEKRGAQAGEGQNRFWWNGRTSGRGSGRTAVSEEIWSDEMNTNQRTDRPLARNGRYFVYVTVTDWDGEQKRMMKPVVLMK